MDVTEVGRVPLTQPIVESTDLPSSPYVMVNSQEEIAPAKILKRRGRSLDRNSEATACKVLKTGRPRKQSTAKPGQASKVDDLLNISTDCSNSDR